MTLDRLHRISETRLKDGLKSLGFDMSDDVSCSESTGNKKNADHGRHRCY
jgi:hypothetical protein